MGDHAVVHGYPCIVTAVNKRLAVTVEKGETDRNHMSSCSNDRFLVAARDAFREHTGIMTPVEITTSTQFSHEVGLGSSSAVTVATIYALSLLFKQRMPLPLIFSLGYKAVLSVQGTGSGFDIAAATFGQTIRYVKGDSEPLVVLPDPLPLVVGYSGSKANTPTLIRRVKKRMDGKPDEVTGIFSEMEREVEYIFAALAQKNWKDAGASLSRGHGLLQELEVSTPRLDAMVAAACEAGAWGAKLSGAGGGDCMIALVSEENKGNVEEAIRESGGEIIPVHTGVPGVSIYQQS